MSVARKPPGAMVGTFAQPSRESEPCRRCGTKLWFGTHDGRLLEECPHCDWGHPLTVFVPRATACLTCGRPGEAVQCFQCAKAAKAIREGVRKAVEAEDPALAAERRRQAVLKGWATRDAKKPRPVKEQTRPRLARKCAWCQGPITDADRQKTCSEACARARYEDAHARMNRRMMHG